MALFLFAGIARLSNLASFDTESLTWPLQARLDVLVAFMCLIGTWNVLYCLCFNENP